MRRFFYCLVLVIGSEALAWDGITAPTTVASIQLGSDGSFSFTLAGNIALCSNGSSSTKNRGAVVAGTWTENADGGGSVTMTAEGVKAMFSALNAALLSGRQVVIYSSPSNGVGWGCRVGAITLL